MKFILFSDSDTIRKRVLALFSESERDILTLNDQDLLFSSVAQFYHLIVLIDVKFKHFPAFKIAKDLREKFSDRNIKLFFLMPAINPEENKRICQNWSADGVITYEELESGINLLLRRFPQVMIGNFKEKPFLKLLMEIKSREFTGTLTVNKEDHEKGIYFEKGEPRYAITSRREERIGELLVLEGKINKEDLPSLLEEAKQTDKRFGEFLLDRNLVTEKELRQVLEKQMEEIFESIFAWGDASYTLSNENIAANEDVLMTRGLDELIYHGIMHYLDVSIPGNYYPELLVPPDEVAGRYPLSERALKLLELMDGRESIESLSYKTDCTLKEIERLVYLLRETGYLVLLPLPKEEEKPQSAVIGRIATTEVQVDITPPEIPAKSQEVTEPSQEVVEEVKPEAQGEERRELTFKGEEIPVIKEYERMVSRPRRGILTNALITIAAVVVTSVLIMLVMKKRSEEKVLRQEIERSHELINTDSVVALKNATSILSDCLKKRNDLTLGGMLAFAYIRIYELTGQQEYLDRARKIVEGGGLKGNGDIDWKSITLLLSLVEGDISTAEQIFKNIKETPTPISAYSIARYKIERLNDPNSVLTILMPFSEGESRALKLELANAFSLAGRVDELKAIVDDLKREIPGHPDVIMLRGDISYLSGNYNEAETLYRLSLESRPGHLQSTIRLARAHLALNKPDLVISEITPIIERTSIETACGKNARFIYGSALKLLKRYEMSKEVFLQLASYYPSDDGIKREIDAINRERAKTEALSMSKPSVKSILRRARRLYEQGSYEDAAKEFERGLEKADDEFLYWYALTLRAMGNSTAAFLQLKKAEGKNPRNPLVHKELGRLYKERGNEEEAERHFKLYLQYFKK